MLAGLEDGTIVTLDTRAFGTPLSSELKHAASVQRIVSATCNGHAVTASASEDCTVQVNMAGAETVVHKHKDYIYGLSLCVMRSQGKDGGDNATVGLVTGGWDGAVNLLDLEL